MNNCKEFVLDDLMAVTAIPVSSFVIGTAMWQVEPEIPKDDFLPVLDNAIVIGKQPATEDGRLIPIKRMTGKVKDGETDSLAGRMHTVKVTCEVDDRNLSIDDEGLTLLDYLLLLERTPSHLLLAFRDGMRAFVQATEDTYLCHADRDGGKVHVTISIQNIMGAQLIF